MPSKSIQKVKTTDRLEQCQIFEDIEFVAAKSSYKGIIVTPVCDIVNPGKLHFYNFCAVIPFKILFFVLIKEKFRINEKDFQNQSIGNDRKKQICEEVKRIINNQGLKTKNCIF